MGAVDFVAKPEGRESSALAAMRAELTAKVKAAARSGVAWDDGGAVPEPPPAGHASPVAQAASPTGDGRISLIAIGSSTGGVPGVTRILSHLPADAPPVVVVQHMPKAFTGSFSSRLNSASRLEVREATDGETLRRGVALVAPGGMHMLVARKGAGWIAELSSGPKVSGHRPSVDLLFGSCASIAGSGCLGVILTGMGKDGARGLLDIKEAGGITLAESEESCVIYGMPKAAIDLGAAGHVVTSEEMPSKVGPLPAAMFSAISK